MSTGVVFGGWWLVVGEDNPVMRVAAVGHHGVESGK
jgi:hypothetical protein